MGLHIAHDYIYIAEITLCVYCIKFGMYYNTGHILLYVKYVVLFPYGSFVPVPDFLVPSD